MQPTANPSPGIKATDKDLNEGTEKDLPKGG